MTPDEARAYFWADQYCDTRDALVAAGLSPDVARQAARADIQFRRAVAGRRDLHWFIGGDLIEDDNGSPAGMEPNLRVPAPFDEAGRFVPVHQGGTP